MARHVWSLLCRRTLIDAQTDSLSIIDHVERATAHPSVPIENFTAVNFQCRLVSLWVRSNTDQPETASMRVALQFPDGTMASYSDPTAVDLQTFGWARVFITLGVLPFKGPGRCEFLVEASIAPDAWQEVARLPLDLQLEDSTSQKIADSAKQE
jgi:hypothetical protein